MGLRTCRGCAEGTLEISQPREWLVIAVKCFRAGRHGGFPTSLQDAINCRAYYQPLRSWLISSCPSRDEKRSSFSVDEFVETISLGSPEGLRDYRGADGFEARWDSWTAILLLRQQRKAI
jgi:hypothetical protein